MFGVVTSDGDVMCPFIFPHDLRFNAITEQIWATESSLIEFKKKKKKKKKYSAWILEE